MKKLFICETPIQIIVTLCIKMQYLNQKDEIDILVADTFKDYDAISKRIQKLSIFNNVYNANINFKKKFQQFYFMFNTGKYLKKNVKLSEKYYDELYFWNYDSFTASLRAYFFKKNKKLKSYFFEEGYISYFPYKNVVQDSNSKLFKLVDFKNKLMHNLSFNNISGIYLFEPDLLLYTPPFPIYKIDRNVLNLEEFKNNIKYIFNVDEVAKKYDKKYIILEEYHEEYNDEEIFYKIADIVGKDNVIIKLHPRRPTDRFSKNGIKTLGSDGIPWEALLISEDFSNKVIISIGSSSVTTQRILFGNENMNAYLLFKFMGANLKQFDIKYIDFWNKLESKNSNFGIHIPNTIDEFYDMLKKEKEK